MCQLQGSILTSGRSNFRTESSEKDGEGHGFLWLCGLAAGVATVMC